MCLCQGWTPLSNRSGSGGWSILSGSGGSHHRAHPPLHPGGGSQHLQRHADEPQLCGGHTGAVQLACAPQQVNTSIKKNTQAAGKIFNKMPTNSIIILFFFVTCRTFTDSTPSVVKKTSEWKQEDVSLVEHHLASYIPQEERLSSLCCPAPQGSPPWRRRDGGVMTGYPRCRLLTRAVTLSNNIRSRST